MDMLTALNIVWTQKEEMATRPVSWAGKGVAIVSINDMFVFVSKEGMALAPIPGSETFTDWETLNIEALESEMDALEAIKANLAKRTPEAPEQTPEATPETTTPPEDTPPV